MSIDELITCVAFDFDGTLVDSNPIKEGGFVAVAKRRGIDIGLVRAVLERLPGGNRFEISAALARQIESLPSAARRLADLLAHDYTNHCLDAVATCDEVPGATLALQRLHESGVPLYINSATPQIALEPIVVRRGLGNYFSGILGGPSSKSDNLQKICNAEGCAARQLLFVGDSDDDARAAAGYGCQFVGITLDGRSRFSVEVQHTRRDLSDLATEVRAAGTK